MNSPVELRISRLATSGEGIAEYEGRAVFIPGTLVDEVARVFVESDGKALRGKLLEVVSHSPDRREPLCPLATRCGGCDWIHMSPEAQRFHKEQLVWNALERLGGIQLHEVERWPFVESALAWGYRRRAVLHPSGAGLGFHGRRSHEMVIVEHCPALTQTLAHLPKTLAGALGSANLKDIEEVRLLECEGRIALSFHLKASLKPRLRSVIERLLRDGLIDGALVDGKGPPERFGKPILEEAGVLLRPDGFAQANSEVNRQLVRRAVEVLQVDASHAVLELYCGNGNFTLELSQVAQHVTAVEFSGVSLGLAQEAVLRRRIGNVRLVQGDSEKVAVHLGQEAARFQRMLVDPPRAGAPGVARWASQLLVERLVYISCDPSSLARDARALVQAGFLPVGLQLFDLFAQTHHVETLMVFAR